MGLVWVFFFFPLSPTRFTCSDRVIAAAGFDSQPRGSCAGARGRCRAEQSRDRAARCSRGDAKYRWAFSWVVQAFSFILVLIKHLVQPQQQTGLGIGGGSSCRQKELAQAVQIEGFKRSAKSSHSSNTERSETITENQICSSHKGDEAAAEPHASPWQRERRFGVGEAPQPQPSQGQRWR